MHSFNKYLSNFFVSATMFNPLSSRNFYLGGDNIRIIIAQDNKCQGNRAISWKISGGSHSRQGDLERPL